jgi:hypothetical protein
MTTTSLIRWGGLASLVAGVLTILASVLLVILTPYTDFPKQAASPAFVPLQTLGLVGTILLLLGLVALYAYQAAATGVLGFVSFLMAFVGAALNVGGLFTSYVAAALANAAPNLLQGEPPPPLNVVLIAMSVIFGVGLILFGIATLLSRRLPRGAVLLLIVGAAISIVEMPLSLPFPVAEVLVSLGLIWMGYTVWSSLREPLPSATGEAGRQQRE